MYYSVSTSKYFMIGRLKLKKKKTIFTLFLFLTVRTSETFLTQTQIGSSCSWQIYASATILARDVIANIYIAEKWQWDICKIKHSHGWKVWVTCCEKELKLWLWVWAQSRIWLLNVHHVFMVNIHAKLHGNYC